MRHTALVAAGLLILLSLASPAAAQNPPPPRDPAGRVGADPLAQVSSDTLLAYLEDLTSIEAHSGWRTSTTRGEVEAFLYVQQTLEAMDHLEALGLELEHQPFRTEEGIELWESRLDLTVAGSEHEVPAHAHLGFYDLVPVSMLVDSDGILNDSEREPVTVEGPVLVVTDHDQLMALTIAEAAGRVVFADFALFDFYVGGFTDTLARAQHLVGLAPAGIVLVTTFSNVVGESHGTCAGDINLFRFLEPHPPNLNLRLEDLAAIGITSWADLGQVESARLTVDIDVYSPGNSQNLIARIPGADPSRAMILSAHLDSPNTPGALDDGGGSVTLLEVARVLDRLRIRPPVDLYLVWYGSHERGLYGSSNFVAGHPELLDRALAMLQVDCLSAPLDGRSLFLNLQTWSYARHGDARLTWPDYLAGIAAGRGIYAEPRDIPGITSDNTSYAGFDVPNLNLIYADPHDGVEVHYGGHLHDPYDTAELARSEVAALEDMVRLALIAALYTGVDGPLLRVTPTPDRRAVFVASHTEDPHMTPVAFTPLGMSLAWDGFDVDIVPYGQQVTPADLEDADLVVALPVHDYPSVDGDVTLYDEAWDNGEVDALADYVAGGGLLVLTNTNHRLKYFNAALAPNEDWSDANTLAARFGVEYQAGSVDTAVARTEGDSPLVDGLVVISIESGNGLPFTVAEGQVLARAGEVPVMTLVAHGAGEVLVLADLAILGDDGQSTFNHTLYRNLAAYARGRR